MEGSLAMTITMILRSIMPAATMHTSYSAHYTRMFTNPNTQKSMRTDSAVQLHATANGGPICHLDNDIQPVITPKAAHR